MRILFRTFIIAFFLLVSLGFKSDENSPVFACKFNGKEFSIKGFEAHYRIITGGHKQLSLSNNKFETFIFLNPKPGKLDLSTARNDEVCIRYVDQGSKQVFKPIEGNVVLEKLDLEKGIVEGTFEMVLKSESNSKNIEVTNGAFKNIPVKNSSMR